MVYAETTLNLQGYTISVILEDTPDRKPEEYLKEFLEMYVKFTWNGVEEKIRSTRSAE